MSEVFDHATVSVMMADYAVTDRLNKLQVIGGGLQVVGRDHHKGTTAAFALVVSMTFHPDQINEQYAFEVLLEEIDGSPVEVGTATDSGGKKIRFGQSMQVEEPQFRGAGVPRHTLPPRAQVVLYFNTGLPLPGGRPLQWRVRIDGDTRPDWQHRFYVPGPPAAPVIG